MRKILAATASALVLLLGGCADDSVPAAADPDVDTVDTANDFDTLDANGGSYLDVDEVAEWADDTGVYEEWDEDADSELDRDEISTNAFELWDGDADGSISEEEWETATELWYPDDAAVTVFSDVDGDGDSELDADEFSEGFDYSALGESWTDDPLDEETFSEGYFELYGTDDDGRVSDTEWTNGSALFGSPNE